MSHISTIETMILDLDGLAEACRDRGLELVRGQTSYRTYAGATNACEHAIVVPGNKAAYEIGLVRCRYDERSKKLVADASGPGWMLGYDSWAGGKGMMKKVGEGCGELVQRYGYRAARNKAKSLGWEVREETERDGSIKLYCTPKPSFGNQQAVAANW